VGGVRSVRVRSSASCPQNAAPRGRRQKPKRTSPIGQAHIDLLSFQQNDRLAVPTRMAKRYRRWKVQPVGRRLQGARQPKSTTLFDAQGNGRARPRQGPRAGNCRRSRSTSRRVRAPDAETAIRPPLALAAGGGRSRGPPGVKDRPPQGPQRHCRPAQADRRCVTMAPKKKKKKKTVPQCKQSVAAAAVVPFARDIAVPPQGRAMALNRQSAALSGPFPTHPSSMTRGRPMKQSEVTPRSAGRVEAEGSPLLRPCPERHSTATTKGRPPARASPGANLLRAAECRPRQTSSVRLGPSRLPPGQGAPPASSTLHPPTAATGTVNGRRVDIPSPIEVRHNAPANVVAIQGGHRPCRQNRWSGRPPRAART